MRISSPKTICTGILILGLVGVAALAGGSYAVHQQTMSSFSEEGYIISFEENEDNLVTNTQVRFAEGTKWSNSNGSYVTFRDENNNSVNVDADSFIHYGSMSIASTAAGTITDLDQYQIGILESYYLNAGSILTYDGDSFTIETGDNVIRMQDFVWKNSSEHYLFGSPEIVINLSDGQQIATSTGFLEVKYIDEDEAVVRMSDGENVWQVLSKGTTISIANGIVTDCETGEIASPDSSAESDETSENRQTLSLGNISINAEGSIVVNTQQQISQAPIFHFTLINGEDGSDGVDGTVGKSGEDGADGETGEDGRDGEQGDDGDTGENGTVGISGGIGEKGAEGGQDVGEKLNIGMPTAYAGKWEWAWDASKNTYTLDFGVYYDFLEEDVADITLEDNKAYYYLYDIETGERVALSGSVNNIVYWDGRIPFKSESETAQEYKTGTITGLEPGKTYSLIVGDTYVLGGNTYTRFVMERIFTVGGSSVSVLLTDRGSNVFQAEVSVGESSDSLNVTGVNWTATVSGGTEFVTGRVAFDDESEPLRFEITGLQSDTTYDVTCEVEYETSSKKSGSVTCTNTWTTTKQEPKVGGISLTAEDGYLKAEALGTYNASAGTYDALEDPDDTIESITFLMYKAEDINKAAQAGTKLGDVEPLLKTEVTDVNYAYFQVDGDNFVNNYSYYVMAIYTYNDGQTEVTVPVYDSDTSATTANTKKVGNIEIPKHTNLAIGYDTARKSSEVTLSFSGTGSGTYNNATDDTEGTSYDSLHGSVLVNLNGVVVRVDDSHKLTLTVTDALTYKKDYTYTECGGKQGNIEGSFSLPLAIDGLLSNNTYTITLSGEVYDKNLGTYKPDVALGTFVVRTDVADPIRVQLEAVDEGIGANFWLNNRDAVAVKDTTEQSYTENPEYTKGVSASYRNLSGIVFELWGAKASDPDNYSTLIGNCTVTYGTITPGKSRIYNYYYGTNTKYYSSNTVGVGDSFRWKFSYVDGSGTVYESGLEEYSSFRIKIRDEEGVYDYTYNRRMGSTSVYDYFITGNGLDTSQYINYLTCTSNTVDCRIGTRPISPTEVLTDGYALTVTEEKDTDGAVKTIAIDNNFKDSYGYSEKVTFYAVNQENYENVWNPADPLDTLKQQGANGIIGFRLTLPVSKDSNGICTIPKIYIHLVKPDAGESYPGGLSQIDENDFGYIGYKARTDGDYDVYVYSGTDTTQYFFATGESFVFLYDVQMNYLGESFSYPFSYYDKGWVTGGVYIKSTALQSKAYLLAKQEPLVQTRLISTTIDSPEDMDTATATDKWEIHLTDPDNAVLASSLQGYMKDPDSGVILSGGLYNQNNQESQLTYNTDAEAIMIRFTLENTEYVLRYKDSEDGENWGTMVAALSKVNGKVEYTVDDQTQTAIFQKMIDKMKEDDGLTVQIENLTNGSSTSDPGIWYNWCVQFSYANKIADNQHGTKILAEDNYAGCLDLSQVFDGTYDLITDEDGDKVTIQFIEKNSYVDSRRQNIYRRMGQVYLEVYKEQENSGNGTDGAESDRVLVGGKWCTINYNSQDGFTLSFNISEFDNAKLSDAKKLSFEFMFYYDSGARGYTEPESADDGATGNEKQYYALYQMTNGPAGQYLNLKIPTWSKSIGANMYQIGSVEFAKAYQKYTVVSEANSTGMESKDRIEYLDFADRSDYTSRRNVSNYANNSVMSFVPLKTYKVEVQHYAIEQISPTLNQVDASSGLDDFTLEMQVGNYDLMHYPNDDGEDLYFYYLLYETKPAEDPSQEDELKLVGAMIGHDAEEDDKEEGAISLYRTVTADFTGLNQDQDYLVAIYFKDMRKDDPKTDGELFATVFNGTNESYKKDKLYTNGTVLKNIAKLLTGVDAGYWDKEETDEESGMTTTVRTFETKLTSAFSLVGVSNEMLASNPYEVSTLNGIMINTVTADFGFSGAYILEDGTSGKAITAEIEAASDLTKAGLSVCYTLERRPIADTTDDTWETVLYDSALYNETAKKGLLTSEYNADENKDDGTSATLVFAPLAKDESGNIVATSFDTLREVAEKYPVTKTDESADGGDGGENTGGGENPNPEEEPDNRKAEFESLTYYPLQNLTDTTKRYIVPGYSYRLRTVILKNNTLVSLDKNDITQRSKTSKIVKWTRYEYGDQVPLVIVRDIAKESNSFSCSITTRGNALNYNTWNLLENVYYVRLAVYDNEKENWTVLTDTKYYGTIYNSSIRDYPFKVGYGYKLSFQNLDASKNYRLQFYTLADTDYDNRLNVLSGTSEAVMVPFGGNLTDNDTNIFYIDSNTKMGTNRVSTLETNYIGYANATNSDSQKEWFNRQYTQVLSNNSDTISTLASGQPGTIGTWYKTQVNNATSLTLSFSDASNMGAASRVEYSLSYFPSDTKDTTDYPTISGTVYKNSTSVLDNGTTSGLGTLTVQNQSFNLTRKGTYYLGVRVTYPTSSGTSYVEKLDTIIFYVD